MDLRSLFLQKVRCGVRSIYVNATTGSDANNGAIGTPYASINWAVHQAQPGDQILVASGTYTYTEVNGFTGSATAWLGILPLDADSIVKVHVASPTDNFFNIMGSSFVGVFGLEIYGNQNDSNTNGSGISIYGNSHHIVIWGCTIHDFPGGGVNCFDVSGSHDLLDISFNTIYGTSKYSPSNTSGISIFAPRDLTQTTWDGVYGYKIVGNYIFDCICTVPFVSGGFDFVTDGNGISIDKLSTMYGYSKPVLIEGNVIVGCGGRAVHVFESVNVDVVHNTGIGNLRTDSQAINDSCEFDGTTDATVVISNNVIFPLHTNNWKDATSSFAHNVILGGTQSVIGTNVDRHLVGFSYFQTSLVADDLLTLLPITSFVPGTLDTTSKYVTAIGYQSLGHGVRPQTTWAVGALEAELATRYLMSG